MNDVTQPTLAKIREFADLLDADPDVAERFVGNPIRVLRERDLDLEFPQQSGYHSMGELMEQLDPAARVATVRSIASFTAKMEPRNAPEVAIFVVVVAVAIANAIAGANAAVSANALTNANANTEVNANANGASAALVNPTSPTHRVALFDGYDESSVAQELSEMHLARPRQVALLKRVALDGEHLGPPQALPDGVEHRVSTYTFQGRELRVESRITADEVTILDTRIS